MTDAAGVTVRGTEHRAGALIEDVIYAGPEGEPVEAFLIRPDRAEASAGPGILFWHWFDPKAPDGNRTQFIEEAVELSTSRVVSLLPQGRFPWAADPIGGEADAAAVEAEVGRLRLGIDLLALHPAVDPSRLGLVGHDFGGMLAAVAASREDRLRALVLIAATPRWADWFLPFWDIPEDRLDYLRAMRPVDPIERIGDAGPASVLFQFARHDFFIAAMTGLEFRAVAPDGAELLSYDAEHDMQLREIRYDRRAFLARHLGIGG